MFFLRQLFRLALCLAAPTHPRIRSTAAHAHLMQASCKGLADLTRFLQGGLSNFTVFCGLGDRISDAVKVVMGRSVK